MEALIVRSFNCSVKLLPSLIVCAVICIGCGRGDDDEVTPSSNNQGNNTPPPGVQTKTIKDIENNSYKTVEIGDQEWMAENLKTTKYHDGTDIPNITDNTEWTKLTTGSYAWYNNDFDVFGSTYGALYNGYSISTNKLCPTGWHVPSDAEWKLLIDFLGGADVAGSKLKELGTIAWGNPFSGSTNETGFTALPGGFRKHNDGKFGGIENYGYWWSSSKDETDTSYALIKYMDYATKKVFSESLPRAAGFCVRCVKD
jgi:uncharacterized protein (TIGR02145 family)